MTSNRSNAEVAEEVQSVRQVAVAVPGGTLFPLTDHELRPIDFQTCEITPTEQIMVTELQADAASYVSIDTNENGSCSLHAPFGSLVDGTLYCAEGRQLAANVLRSYKTLMPQSSTLHNYVLQCPPFYLG